MTDKKMLAKAARNMRRNALKMAYECGKNAHLGGGMSLMEIMAVLYGAIANDKNLPDEKRDRVILSKGHGVLALYAALAEFDRIDMDLLNTFQKNGTDLVAHPVMNAAIGIEASSGSLGQGVSMAVGLALAAKKRSYSYNTYAVLGNGECDEGSVWEAAISAVNFELDNLTLIIDDNKMQSDGKTAEIMRTNGLAKMFGGIGCHVVEADGHNIEKLILAINDRQEKLPTVVVANTVKGKGISFMENNNEWHHNRLTEKQYLAALEELKELEKEAQ